ncbi:MAG: alanine racemase [Bacilli bacterium]
MKNNEQYRRPTYAAIDLDAIRHNVSEFKERVPNDTMIIAAVKANGYGHGAVEVARTALKNGVTMLAVAMIEEAVQLRMAGITADILILGNTPPSAISLALQHNLIVTLHHPEWLQQVSESLTSQDRLRVHLKVDSGMGRLGVTTSEGLQAVLTLLRTCPAVQCEGVFTHFATADEADETYFERQVMRFDTLLSECVRSLPNAEKLVVHSSNSAAAMRYRKQHRAAVRIGIALYGYYPSPHTKASTDYTLQPAMSLHSELVSVKQFSAAHGIGYGATHQTTEGEWIGVIPIGYADGWLRALNTADVLIEGRRYPTVGRVCMDQFMVQLDRPYPVGTRVTLFGENGGSKIEIDEVADRFNSINYEICCMIGDRVPRVYFANGVETGAVFSRFVQS